MRCSNFILRVVLVGLSMVVQFEQFGEHLYIVNCNLEKYFRINYIFGPHTLRHISILSLIFQLCQFGP